MLAWVLWHRYGDGSGAHIERVYLNFQRAKEDHMLLTVGDSCKTGASEWHLDQVAVLGPDRP